MLIKVISNHKIAKSSNDHIFPHGTRDESRNLRFNSKIYNHFNHLFIKKQSIRILDLGCAGGGFVQDCLNDGYVAVGLEGSDFCLKNKYTSWIKNYQKFLFTQDITKKFLILESSPYKALKKRDTLIIGGGE